MPKVTTKQGVMDAKTTLKPKLQSAYCNLAFERAHTTISIYDCRHKPYPEIVYPQMGLPLTLGDALEQGWTIERTATFQGYVSRKTDINLAPLFVAPRNGNRRGLLFAMLPNFASSSYAYRVYLTPPLTD